MRNYVLETYCEQGESYFILQAMRNSIHNNAFYTREFKTDRKNLDGSKIIAKNEIFQYDIITLYKIVRDVIMLSSKIQINSNQGYFEIK